MLPLLKQFEVNLPERLPHAENMASQSSVLQEHKGELEDITADAWNVSGPPSEPLSLITPVATEKIWRRDRSIFIDGPIYQEEGGGDGFSHFRPLEGILNEP